MPQESGALRDFSGQTVELLINLIYDEFSKDNIYYLAIGKRNSATNKRIYYHPERIKLELVEVLCKDFEELIFR